MTSTASVFNPSPAPRFGWRTVGAIAAATLGSGPALVLWFTLLSSLTDPETFTYEVVMSPLGFAVTLAESMIYGSVISLPATLVHVVAVALLAHRARDAFGWSLASGAVLGVVLADLLIWDLYFRGAGGGFDLLERQLRHAAEIATPFGATGAVIGLLYWRIAIRPRRRWRLLRQHGEDAVRAME